eukprot:GHVQ01002589.1.p1 GENE.GHVQ01002589.1~~GHVQ01002589.1.p1  ORF type:complete len:888 (+),score=98.87 GHVQ01002589.1:61-2724(+)
MQKGFKAPVVGKRHLTRCTMAIKSRRRRLAMTRDEARLFRLVGKLSGGSNSSMSSSRPSGVISLRAQTGVGVGDSVGRVTRSLSIASSNGRADRLMSNLLASWERLRLVSIKVSGKILFMLTVLMISTIAYWYARIRGKADANKKPSKPTKAVPKETEVHTADVPGIPVIPSEDTEMSQIHTVTVTEPEEPPVTTIIDDSASENPESSTVTVTGPEVAKEEASDADASEDTEAVVSKISEDPEEIKGIAEQVEADLRELTKAYAPGNADILLEPQSSTDGPVAGSSAVLMGSEDSQSGKEGSGAVMPDKTLPSALTKPAHPQSGEEQAAAMEKRRQEIRRAVELAKAEDDIDIELENMLSFELATLSERSKGVQQPPPLLLSSDLDTRLAAMSRFANAFAVTLTDLTEANEPKVKLDSTKKLIAGYRAALVHCTEKANSDAEKANSDAETFEIINQGAQNINDLEKQNLSRFHVTDQLARMKATLGLLRAGLQESPLKPLAKGANKRGGKKQEKKRHEKRMPMKERIESATTKLKAALTTIREENPNLEGVEDFEGDLGNQLVQTDIHRKTVALRNQVQLAQERMARLATALTHVTEGYELFKKCKANDDLQANLKKIVSEAVWAFDEVACRKLTELQTFTEILANRAVQLMDWCKHHIKVINVVKIAVAENLSRKEIKPHIKNYVAKVVSDISLDAEFYFLNYDSEWIQLLNHDAERILDVSSSYVVAMAPEKSLAVPSQPNYPPPLQSVEESSEYLDGLVRQLNVESKKTKAGIRHWSDRMMKQVPATDDAAIKNIQIVTNDQLSKQSSLCIVIKGATERKKRELCDLTKAYESGNTAKIVPMLRQIFADTSKEDKAEIGRSFLAAAEGLNQGSSKTKYKKFKKR